MNRIISPSLLSADFSILKEQIEIVTKAGAKRLHIDCMDGHFVPNFTFGPFIVKAIRKLTDLHLETHLMIDNPDKYIKNYADAGSDTIIMHYEASTDIIKDLKYIRTLGKKSGIAINPNTDYNNIIKYFNYLDYILIMSVFPGFGGQSFIDSTLKKMSSLVNLTKDFNILIGVDGGVNLKTIDKIYNTGIDITIIGSALYGAENVEKRYYQLLNE